jgi:predicted naringenin-chalcone synthase
MNPHVRRTPIRGLGCAEEAAGIARGCDLGDYTQTGECEINQRAI